MASLTWFEHISRVVLILISRYGAGKFPGDMIDEI
jgi:hypothetical protein